MKYLFIFFILLQMRIIPSSSQSIQEWEKTQEPNAITKVILDLEEDIKERAEEHKAIASVIKRTLEGVQDDLNRMQREQTQAQREQTLMLESLENLVMQTAEDKLCEPPSITMADLGCVSIVSSAGVADDELVDGSRMSWEDAQAMCTTLGLNILENIKKDHLQLLSENFMPLLKDVSWPSVWIGGKHSKWISSGMTVDANLWADGEPDEGNQECVYLNLSPESPGLWDWTCSGTLHVLCH